MQCPICKSEAPPAPSFCPQCGAFVSMIPRTEPSSADLWVVRIAIALVVVFVILGAAGLLLATVAAFLLRKPALAAGAPVAAATAPLSPTVRRAPAAVYRDPVAAGGVSHAPVMPVGPGEHNAALLHVLKEEMFAIESEKLSGTLSSADYAEQKAALETVLKRALKKKG